MAPFAVKPPFATDEPDSVFVDQDKRTPRPRQQRSDATAPGGDRDSAYTAFDSYFAGNGPDNRMSGVGDIGRGLMTAGSDYDDSSDDEHQPKQKQAPLEQPTDKHRALYAAATGGTISQRSSPSERGAADSIQQQQRQLQSQRPVNLQVVQQPQPVVHSHGNNGQSAQQLEGSASAGGIANPRQLPAALQSGARPIAAPAPAHSRPPQVAFMRGSHPSTPQRSPNSPSNPYFTGVLPGSPVSATRIPQPLPPPQSPIMPVFVRPRVESNSVKFEEKGEILRGNSEETLLPRGVGGKGDDFWRRFSMVAKEEAKSGSKKSAWLRKTESGSTRLSTWVWLVGILLLIAIGGGIGVGWFLTHNKPAALPVAIGGSADEASTTPISTSSSVVAVSTSATKVTAAPVPTNTNNNNNNNNKRSSDELAQMPAAPKVPAAHRRSFLAHKSH